MALFRRDRPSSPPPAPADPLAALDRAVVPHRLLGVVDRAVADAGRFRSLVAARPAGPVRDRLVAMSARVDAGAVAVHATAMRAAQLDAVATTLDPEAVIAAYKDVRRRDADPELVELHRSRFESVQRVLNARDAIDGQLELLEARLSASVARAAELALAPSGDLDPVETDLGALTDELSALQAGLAEVT